MKSFIVLVVAVVLGYYVYKTYTAPESCAEAFNHCMKTCRRTTTEAPAAQACGTWVTPCRAVAHTGQKV